MRLSLDMLDDFMNKKIIFFNKKIFGEICKVNEDAILLLVGDGPLQGSIRKDD